MGLGVSNHGSAEWIGGIAKGLLLRMDTSHFGEKDALVMDKLSLFIQNLDLPVQTNHYWITPQQNSCGGKLLGGGENLRVCHLGNLPTYPSSQHRYLLWTWTHDWFNHDQPLLSNVLLVVVGCYLITQQYSAFLSSIGHHHYYQPLLPVWGNVHVSSNQASAIIHHYHSYDMLWPL